MTKRHCPLRLASVKFITNTAETHCIEQECAWFDMNTERCGVLTASVAAHTAATILGQSVEHYQDHMGETRCIVQVEEPHD